MSYRSAQYEIENVSKADYPRMISVWEAAVRSTHFFLSEEDIFFYRDLIFHQYFDLVKLKAIRNEEMQVVAFLGTSDHKIEMLFIHPSEMAKGMGRVLVNYAFDVLNIHEVDVNEQNTGAVGFYEAMGFRTIKRSAIDGMGKPYPILHMAIPQTHPNDQ